MIIFLYGPDSYRRKRKLDEILAQYQKRHGVYTMQSFDCADDDDARPRLADSANAQSLFGKAQLFVVRNYFPVPEKLEKQYEAFLRVAQGARDYTLVLLADEMPKKRFAFIAAAPAIAQEFATLTGAAFEQLIKQEASRVCAMPTGRQVRLTPVLLQSLARIYEGDSWGVVTELEKLSLLAPQASSSAALRGPAVSSNVPPRTSPETASPRLAAEASERLVFDGAPRRVPMNVFAASGVFARSSRDTKTALPLLERLLFHEDPAYVFNCLAYQMRGDEKLRFADYDVAVKSGRALYDTALLDYLLV